MASRAPSESVLEAETAVLGSMLLSAEAAASAVERLRPAHFVGAGHDVVFEAAAGLQRAGSSIDVVTLRNALDREGTLNGAVPQVITRLMSDVPSAANHETYIEIVADAAAERVCDAPTSTNAGPPWPTPLRQDAYHGLIGRFVRLIEPYTEADPAALLVGMVVAVGNVIGRGPYRRVGSTRHHTNEFLLSVGDTAVARKGTAQNEVDAFLRLVDSEWADECVDGGLSTGEGLIARFADEGTASARPEAPLAKRVFVVEPEFAILLQRAKRQTNTLSPVMRSAWDSGDMRLRTKENPLTARGAHLSIAAHITCDELRRRAITSRPGTPWSIQRNYFALNELKACPTDRRTSRTTDTPRGHFPASSGSRPGRRQPDVT